jgi:hypothetical protein
MIWLIVIICIITFFPTCQRTLLTGSEYSVQGT